MKLQILGLLLLATTSVLSYEYTNYNSSMKYSTDFSGTTVTMGFATLNDTHFKCLVNLSTPAPANNTANLVTLMVAVNPASMTPGRNSWVGADMIVSLIPAYIVNGTLQQAEVSFIDGHAIAETNTSKDPAVGRLVPTESDNRWSLMNGSNALNKSGDRVVYTAEYSSPYTGVQGEDYNFSKDQPSVKGNIYLEVAMNVSQSPNFDLDENNSVPLNTSYSSIKQFTLPQSSSGSTSNILRNVMAMTIFFAIFMVLFT